jgi:glycerol-3-phosphate dehydrogenase (NAD(P)+)
MIPAQTTWEPVMAIVTIVGAGFMGTATVWPLVDNGHTVRLAGTHVDGEIITSCKQNRFHLKVRRELPGGVRPYHVDETAEALDGAEIIVRRSMRPCAGRVSVRG